MLKKSIFAAVGASLLSALLFGGDAASYVGTSIGWIDARSKYMDFVTPDGRTKGNKSEKKEAEPGAAADVKK